MPDLLADLGRLAEILNAAGHTGDEAFGEATLAGDVVIESGRIRRFEATPKRVEVPRLPPRTSAIVAAFGIGTAPYWVGGARKRDAASREAMLDLHRRVLAGATHPAAAAVLAALKAPIEEAIPAPAPGNYCARVDGEILHEIPEIREAWRRAYEPAEGNPTIRAFPRLPFTRLVSDNVISVRSFDLVLPPDVASGAYAGALNWCLAREGTYLADNLVVTAWLPDAPEIDPTPHLIRRGFAKTERPPWPGRIHVLAMTVNPPARLAVSRYLVKPAETVGMRLDAAYRILAEVNAMRFPQDGATVLPWAHVFEDAPNATPLTVAMLDALCSGFRLPRTALAAIVARLRRGEDVSPLRAGMLTLLGCDPGRPNCWPPVAAIN